MAKEQDKNLDNENNKKYYSDWFKESIKKKDDNYYIINDGILTRKDFSILFENENGKRYIPIEATESLNIYSDIVVSGDFLDYISKKGLNINFYNRYGNIVGSFIGQNNGFRNDTLIKQVRIFDDKEKRLSVARTMEIGMIHNMRANLRYYNKIGRSDILSDSVVVLTDMIKKVEACKSIEKLLLIEARSRAKYYSVFNEIVKGDGFKFIKRSRRPPKDPINALISFGNVFLYNIIATEINKTSLDIRIGFVHSPVKRNQTLNLDIADIFKPIIVDRVIFSMINKRMINAKSHFTAVEDGIYLNKEGKELFINELNKKLESKSKEGNFSMSYKARIRDEIQKILRLIQHNKEYISYKYK